MTEFDFAVIAVFVVSVLLGLWRGFIREILSVLGWPIAFMVSNVYSAGAANLIPLGQGTLRLTLVYGLMFAVVLVAWGILAMLLSKLLKAMGSGWQDRMLGGLFGAVRGALVVLALVWLAGMTALPEQQFWRNAQMSKMADDVALMTKGWLPDSIAQSVRYGIRS